MAARHFATRFIRVNVKNVPFFVEKLKVQTLPCVISFVHGVTVDRCGPCHRGPAAERCETHPPRACTACRGSWCRRRDSLVGFEELGNTDTFATEVLEKRLRKSGTLWATSLGLRACTAGSVLAGASLTPGCLPFTCPLCSPPPSPAARPPAPLRCRRNRDDRRPPPCGPQGGVL